MGDGAPTPSDALLTIGSLYARGEITNPGGPLRLFDSVTGGGLFTTNSDPNLVGVDPLTGLDAPAGTDVGFAGPVRRFLLSGIYNGDFALSPSDTTSPITNDNVLPYWTWTQGATTNVTARWVADASSASGGVIRFTVVANAVPGADEDSYLEQMVPINSSRARRWAYWAASSFLAASVSTANLRCTLGAQYMKSDAVTTTGAAPPAAAMQFDTTLAQKPEVTPSTAPSDAAYLRIRIGITQISGSSSTGTVDLADSWAIVGHDTVLLPDRTTPANTPGGLAMADGIVTLTGLAGTNNPAVALDQAALTLTLAASSGVVLTAGLTPGIKFSPTQVPSADANTLDDYEEGTWTPVLTFVTPGNLAVVYGTQLGRYIKVGKTVHWHAVIITTTFTHTTASGNLVVTGLPFAAATAAGFFWFGNCILRYTKATYTQIASYVASASASLSFFATGTGVAPASVAFGDMPTAVNVSLYASGSYEASA